MSKKDNYLTAPPTEEEIKKYNIGKTSTPSMEEPEGGLGEDIHDLAAGGAQGALLGGGDEALAIPQTIKDKIDGSNEDWLDLWRKHQQQNQEDYKKIQERSPILSTVGELGGAFAMPGGALVRGAEGAAKYGVGAGLGAASGLLNSQSNIEDPKQLLEDTVTGGALGTAATKVGDVLGKATGKGLEKVNNFVDNTPALKLYKTAIQKGLQNGEGFFQTSDADRINALTKQKAADLLGKLESGVSAGNKQFGEFLQPKANINFNPEQQNALKSYLDVLQNSPNSSSPVTQEQINNIKNILTGNATGQEVKDLESSMYQKFSNAPNPEQGEIYKQTGLATKAALNTIPGYDKAFQAWQTPRKAGESLLGNTLAKEIEVKNPTTGVMEKLQIPQKYYGEYDLPQKLSGIENVLEKMSLPKLKGQEQREQFQSFLNNIKNLSGNEPGGKQVLQNMGIPPQTVPGLQNSLEDVANQQAALQRIQGKGSFANNQSVLGELNRGSLTGASWAASTLGKAAKSPVGNGIRDLYQMGDQKLLGIASDLKNAPGFSHIGQALENALKNKSEAMKNAALFTISQSPTARQMIKGFAGGDENDSVPNSPFAPTPHSDIGQ